MSLPGYQALVKKASHGVNERQEGLAGEKRVVRRRDEKNLCKGPVTVQTTDSQR